MVIKSFNRGVREAPSTPTKLPKLLKKCSDANGSTNSPNGSRSDVVEPYAIAPKSPNKNFISIYGIDFMLIKPWDIKNSEEMKEITFWVQNRVWNWKGVSVPSAQGQVKKLNILMLGGAFYLVMEMTKELLCGFQNFGNDLC
jgi:hypothetical protein